MGAYGLQPAGCATCFGASYAFAENPVRALGIASMPLALFMLSYPGVLLSTTSIPIWSRTRWLGALLGTSSMASAARALSLMAPHSAAVKRLEQVSHAAEALHCRPMSLQQDLPPLPLRKGVSAGCFWLAHSLPES